MMLSIVALSNAICAAWIGMAKPKILQGPWSIDEMVGLLTVASGLSVYLAVRRWRAAYAARKCPALLLTADGLERPGRDPEQVRWEDVEYVRLDGSYRRHHVALTLGPGAAGALSPVTVRIDASGLAISARELFGLIREGFERHRSER